MSNERPSSEPQETVNAAERAFIEQVTPAIRAYAEGEPITFSFGQPAFSVELPLEPDGGFSANVNLHDGFFREQGLDPAMATAAISHEVEHLREYLALTRSSDGAKAWREHARKMQADPRLGALDNMVDDVRMNRTVVQRAPSLRPGMERIYTQYAFPDADLQQLPSGEANPLHLQFAQSLLRDAMLPQESAVVTADVREAQAAVLERVNQERKLRGLPAASSFNDVVRQITDPSLSPMSRLALTRRYLEPAYQALYREDLQKELQRQLGDEARPDPNRSVADKIRDIFAGKNPDGENERSTPKEAGKGMPDLSQMRPEDVFPEAYREHAKHRPTTISANEWERVAKDLQDKAAYGLKPVDPNDPRVQEKREFFESNASERPTEEDWRNFQAWHALRAAAYAVRNADGRPVIDELREIFANILSHRRRKRPSPKAPQEEGENLSAEHLVEAWLSLRAGEDSAEVWTVEKTKERPAERVGMFDISIVGDLSGSMLNNGKDEAQKQATILLLAALEEFRRELSYVEGDLRDDLGVRTEAWGFGNGAHLLKPLSLRLEPIHCARVAGGMVPIDEYGTHDYLVLKEIRTAIENDPGYSAKLKARNGRAVPETRRIVLVLTDGDSSNRAKCAQEVASLRALGVKVIGIGITNEGRAAEATYAPDGRVCPSASDLARTTGTLLADLLKDQELGYSDLNTK